MQPEEVNIASLTDLYERLQREQRRQSQQATQNLQLLQRSIRDELRRETKRLESATEAQVLPHFFTATAACLSAKETFHCSGSCHNASQMR